MLLPWTRLWKLPTAWKSTRWGGLPTIPPRGHLRETVGTRMRHTKQSLANREGRVLQHHHFHHRQARRAQDHSEPRTTRSSSRRSFPALLMAWWSAYARRVRWYLTRLIAHRNQLTRTVCSPHLGPHSQYYHRSRQGRALALRLDSLLPLVPWVQDTIPHLHRVHTDPTATTLCLSSENRPSSLGHLQESTVHWPTTPRASRMAIRHLLMDMLCGRTTLRNIVEAPSFMDVRMVMNDGRHRRCLETLDWVGMAMVVLATALLICDEAFVTQHHVRICARCHGHSPKTGSSLMFMRVALPRSHA
jgi:hypothetical protein